MSIAGEKGSSLWKLEGKMTLEDTYPLPKPRKEESVRVPEVHEYYIYKTNEHE